MNGGHSPALEELVVQLDPGCTLHSPCFQEAPCPAQGSETHLPTPQKGILSVQTACGLSTGMQSRAHSPGSLVTFKSRSQSRLPVMGHGALALGISLLGQVHLEVPRVCLNSRSTRGHGGPIGHPPSWLWLYTEPAWTTSSRAVVYLGEDL